VIAFALIGIVGMQLWVVKLGVGIGRAVEHTQLLQQQNSALSAEDSALSSGERVERLALAKGMMPASPAALHFDTVRGPLDARLAAAALAKPIQAPTTSSTPVGGATSTETSTASAGAEASSSAAASATANPTSTLPTGSEASGTEATSTQGPTTPETTAAQAPAPAATEAAPAATGGSTEAASASLGSGGGTGAPGG
jgi:hypothetical protein